MCDINPVHQLFASGTAEVGGAYVHVKSEWIGHNLNPIDIILCVCLCVSNHVPCVVGG